MRDVFWMALRRPLVADMYLAGNSFGGAIQTCNVHVWRKSESLAVEHGTESPEQAYSEALLRAYRRASDAAARVTEMAGGPVESACDAGRALRGVPGLAEYAAAAQARMTEDVSVIIHAYRHGEVSDGETRKFAGTLENALPYMSTFIANPGMPGHTNLCELLIRRYVVSARNMHRALPDIRAAETLSVLQTIHANAHIRGAFPGDIVAAGRGQWRLPERCARPAGLVLPGYHRAARPERGKPPPDSLPPLPQP